MELVLRLSSDTESFRVCVGGIVCFGEDERRDRPGEGLSHHPYRKPSRDRGQSRGQGSYVSVRLRSKETSPLGVNCVGIKEGRRLIYYREI